MGSLRISKSRVPPFPAAAINVGSNGENITEYKIPDCWPTVCFTGSVNVLRVIPLSEEKKLRKIKLRTGCAGANIKDSENGIRTSHS